MGDIHAVDEEIVEFDSEDVDTEETTEANTANVANVILI